MHIKAFSTTAAQRNKVLAIKYPIQTYSKCNALTNDRCDRRTFYTKRRAPKMAVYQQIIKDYIHHISQAIGIKRSACIA